MRKLLWMILFFAVYVWVMSSGRDQMVLEQGKAIYQALVAWFDDAEIEFRGKPKEGKKKSRRWD